MTQKQNTVIGPSAGQMEYVDNVDQTVRRNGYRGAVRTQLHAGEPIGDMAYGKGAKSELTGEPADRLPGWNTMFKA